MDSPAYSLSWVPATALRILQAGTLAVVTLTVACEPFELDRFFVPKEFAQHLTAGTAGLLLLGRLRRLQPTHVDGLLVAFLIASGLSALVAQNGWLAARALAISTSGVVVFWIGRAIREAGLAGPLLRTLALAVVIVAIGALLQAYGVPLWLFAEDRAPGGLLGNRNAVGHLVALGLPLVLLAALRSTDVRGLSLGTLGAALAIAALVLTRSRAAWLGFAVVLTPLALGLPLLAVRWRAWHLLRRFLVVLLAMALGVGAALVLPNALRWTSGDPYRDTAQNLINYQEGSGRGRLVQYQTSLALLMHSPVAPILGVGPGNWPVAYPAHTDPGDPSLARGEAGRTTNPWPSSDAVALVSERGLAGTLLLALAALGLLASTLRGLRRAATADEAVGTLLLLAVLLGTLTVGAFDAVLLLAWPTFVVSAAAGALWPSEHARPLALTPALRTAALVVALAVAFAGAVRSSGQIAAMALYTADQNLAALETAARLDPGNYRLRVRLAQRARDAETRCRHGQAAHALFPHAATAERLARGCD